MFHSVTTKKSAGWNAERLQEAFVEREIFTARIPQNIHAWMIMLAPKVAAGECSYELFVECYNPKIGAIKSMELACERHTKEKQSARET